jgi:tight adherence protein B
MCALLLAGALWLLAGGVGRSKLETRVASFIPDAEIIEDPTVAALAPAPGVPPFLARRRWWPGYALKVDVAGFRRSPVALLKLACAGSLIALVLVSLVAGSVAGFFLGLPLGPFVLWAVVRRAVRKTRAKFADQLPSSIQDMAGAVRGGRSLAGAVQAVTDGADQPIVREFERVIADEQLGRPLEDSLHTVARRMKSEDMEQVALVATLHRRSGSSVAEALDHVAEGARERGELIRELKSLTGQARLSSRILTGLPVVLFFAMNLIEPSYMRPVTHTTGGIIVLVFCVFMISVGWLAMKRIVNVEA